MTYGTDMTFEQRLAKIDLSKVMEHVRADTGMDDATLARAEDLYRKFLTLKGLDTERFLVPPQIVDFVWHAHIIFTRQYMDDCNLLFGSYLHHTPVTGDEGEASSSLFTDVTVMSYKNHFGVDLYQAGVYQGVVKAATCG